MLVRIMMAVLMLFWLQGAARAGCPVNKPDCGVGGGGGHGGGGGGHGGSGGSGGGPTGADGAVVALKRDSRNRITNAKAVGKDGVTREMTIWYGAHELLGRVPTCADQPLPEGCPHYDGNGGFYPGTCDDTCQQQRYFDQLAKINSDLYLTTVDVTDSTGRYMRMTMQVLPAQGLSMAVQNRDNNMKWLSVAGEVFQRVQLGGLVFEDRYAVKDGRIVGSGDQYWGSYFPETDIVSYFGKVVVTMRQELIRDGWNGPPEKIPMAIDANRLLGDLEIGGTMILAGSLLAGGTGATLYDRA